MSFESVLLLLFLVFPLLERLIRFLRARADRASAEPLPATHDRPAPVRRPTAPEVLAEPAPMPAEAVRQVPPPVPGPVLLPPRHPAAKRLSAADRVRAARTSPSREAALPRVRRASTAARRDLLLRGDKADLRRAVVLMTILGPCKALESGPERG